MDQSKPKGKPRMTEEERAALAKKLDDDLEQFMEEMAAKRAAEQTTKKPFDFDEWCKDIDQHPAFMKDLDAGLNGQYADTLSALQALKYDEDDMEDKQLSAERHKDEGNKHFKFKKYRWATDCYSEGIKVQCLDRKLNSVLYGNRAAAQKHIGNLRSAMKDCAMALKFDPRNLKAANRGAECLLELGYAQHCVDWIERAKKTFAFTKETEEEGNVTEAEKKQLDSLEQVKEKADEAVLIEERNKRKARAEERKDLEEKRRLLKALSDRKLNFRPRLPFSRPELMDWSLLDVSLAQTSERYRVSFNQDGNLQWPFLIQYPQVGQVDVLTDCDETAQIGAVLRPMFETPAEWDKDHEFRLDNIRMFVSDEWNEYVMEVWEWSTFGSILTLPGFQIVQGLPVLVIYTRDEIERKLTPVGENKFVIN
ncbi:Tetratricopeptide repeat protein 4 [Trichostrongylus colubriformis]|uniref:Tetratricopeptide repeat protein 4 n=1 Tax=Trichostrongylus colubriformis TaxID=6319 RepID=A0AAN8FH57_TRICO